MLIPLGLYFAASLLTLGVLLAMLLQISRGARDCPTTGAAVRVATLAVAGAFGAIGVGVISLIASFGLKQQGVPLQQAFAMFGAAGIVLGIGFSIAVVNLRDAVKEATGLRAAAQAPTPTMAPAEA